MALIATLSFILLISCFIAAAVAIARVSSSISELASERSVSKYIAEGAAERTRWIIMHDLRSEDRKKQLDALDASGREGPDGLFMADGMPHRLEYYGYSVELKVYDMASGIDISGTNPGAALAGFKQLYFADSYAREQFQAFADKLNDYADQDDFLRPRGMERDEYAMNNLSVLPRNGRLQFREEVLCIPGIEDFFTPDKYGRINVFKIIPPPGLRHFSSKSNFFSVSPIEIRLHSGLDENEVERVMEARKLWINEKIPLSESIPPLAYNRLKSIFSFRESGYYTIVVSAARNDSSPGNTLVSSQRILTAMPPQGIHYYEYMSY